MARERLREASARYFEGPVARALNAVGIGPNVVTLLGLTVAAGAGHLISRGYLFWGGLVLLLASVMDLLDGALARLTGRATPLGAALDSVVDRLAEAIVLLGVFVFYLRGDHNIGAYLAFGTLVASYMVSYTRARGEGLGIAMKESGLVTRTERVVIMVGGLLTGWLLAALVIISAFSAIATAQRIWRIRRQT